MIFFILNLAILRKLYKKYLVFKNKNMFSLFKSINIIKNMTNKTKLSAEISKIFTSEKIINVKVFNILGLQVFRYILAKIAFFFSKFFFNTMNLLRVMKIKAFI